MDVVRWTRFRRDRSGRRHEASLDLLACRRPCKAAPKGHTDLTTCLPRSRSPSLLRATYERRLPGALHLSAARPARFASNATWSLRAASRTVTLHGPGVIMMLPSLFLISLPAAGWRHVWVGARDPGDDCKSHLMKNSSRAALRMHLASVAIGSAWRCTSPKASQGCAPSRSLRMARVAPPPPQPGPPSPGCRQNRGRASRLGVGVAPTLPAALRGPGASPGPLRSN